MAAVKYLVTGGAGFIGRHLVAGLCARELPGETDPPVTVLDNLRRGTPQGLSRWIEAGVVRFIRADVRDAGAVRSAVAGASVVFHLAGQSNVLGAEDDLDYAIGSNVDGTYVLLREASAAGVTRLVFTSSREVYGQADLLPVPETAPLQPKNAYGAGKAAAEMLARAFAARTPLEVVTLRLANVYGPGDSGRVVPLWLDRAARGQELVIYGGNQVLDFVWVGDVVDSLLRAAHVPASALGPAPGSSRYAVINVGSGQGTPISVLARRVLAATGREVPVRIEPSRAAEVERYVADVTRLRTLLGVTPYPPLAHLPAMAPRAPAGAGRWPAPHQVSYAAVPRVRPISTVSPHSFARARARSAR